MQVEFVKKWLDLFYEAILENQEYLTELDTAIGDGDHGNNMVRGMKAVKEKVLEEDYDSSSDLFKAVAMQLMSTVGGASGALYGTAFLEMAKNDASDLLECVTVGLAGIQKRGKAEVGDKTMVDIWASVKDLLESGENLTGEKIDEFVNSTKDLQAKKGRASYLGERSIGHIDPGTYSSALLFKTYLKA